ncbi:MAG: hypothetical protein ACRYG4_08045 [Janthinobacterium lividum]
MARHGAAGVPAGPGPGKDPDDIAALLHAAARAGEAMTYAEVLNAIGHAFSRPKMRALCAVLEHVDSGERGAGRPDLAVLVVRASDRLPGQGWWVAEAARGSTYAGPWLGPLASAHIRTVQASVFAYWRPL